MNELLQRLCHQFNQSRNSLEPQPRVLPVPQNAEFAALVLREVQQAEQYYNEVKADPELEKEAFARLVATRDVRDAIPLPLRKEVQQRIPTNSTPRQLTKGDQTQQACINLSQQGLTTRQIADKLAVSERHVRRILNQPLRRTSTKHVQPDSETKCPA